ncbi:unnamed protein product [Ectocarpus sp. CCAP 1310/34]|nr:unnamed protein product [Ectocarpus sp. CCAP 1310/34]
MEAAEAAANGSSRSLAGPPTTNLTSTTYLQTYVIMKPTGTEEFGTNNAYRDVLFRFGSWCYSGTVQLIPTLALVDIPHVIPALRMQQSKLDFMCDVTQVPSKSPFAAPLEHMQRLMPLMEEQVASSEAVLTDLLENLSDMGLEDSVSSWFDGDSMQSFFEFQAGEKESAETRTGGGQEGEEHAKATSTMMVEGGAASVTNEQGGSSGAGWASGDLADPVIGGSGGTTGGGSAQAQPKHSGAGDRGGVGRGIGAVGADGDHDDRPSRGGGIHESKRPWETDAIRGRTNGLETGSKDSGGDPPGVSQASASAGAKSGPVIGNERHHAAAKALTNTKVALPHHLSPMTGLEDKLKRMRSDMQNENGDAPWDAFGRPRTALLGTKQHK